MGMLDFLKRNPEDDYDEFDDDFLDDEALDDGFGEPKESQLTKNRKPLLRFSQEEEDEALTLPGSANSRFSEDYQTYLFSQVERANENLRRLTEEAYELVRQTAGQPLPEGMEAPEISAADFDNEPIFDEPFEEELPDEDDEFIPGEDDYIPGADEEDAVYHDEFDDGFDDFEEKPDFGEFGDEDDTEIF